MPGAQKQPHGLGSLNDADDSRQNYKNTTLRAARYQPGRWRLRIKAALTRTTRQAKNGSLTVESENAAIYVRLPKKDTGIVDEVPRREIICSINK